MCLPLHDADRRRYICISVTEAIPDFLPLLSRILTCASPIPPQGSLSRLRGFSGRQGPRWVLIARGQWVPVGSLPAERGPSLQIPSNGRRDLRAEAGRSAGAGRREVLRENCKERRRMLCSVIFVTQMLVYFYSLLQILLSTLRYDFNVCNCCCP